MMRDKLGLIGTDEKDKFLIVDLLTWMHQKKIDYTNTFCHLMDYRVNNNQEFEGNDFKNWKRRWQERLLKNDNSPQKYMKLMRSVNPLVIPRNHKVEEALNEANKNNMKPLKKILDVLSKPYSKQKEISDYQNPSFSKNKYQTFCGT